MARQTTTPDRYQAHAGLGISHDDLAAVASHLVAAMREAEVPEDILIRAIAVGTFTEPDIVESRSLSA